MYKLPAILSIFYVAVAAQQCGFSANVSFGMGQLSEEFATARLGFGDPALFDQDGHEIMSTRIANVQTPWAAYGCPPGHVSTTEATITLGYVAQSHNNAIDLPSRRLYASAPVTSIRMAHDSRHDAEPSSDARLSRVRRATDTWCSNEFFAVVQWDIAGVWERVVGRLDGRSEELCADERYDSADYVFFIVKPRSSRHPETCPRLL
ncbi:hypothetical protein B0H17DRAFT_1134077 [Mycena rosella]|uniref:Uncharacterized protein n=1 Tax=Mycena rosella TaxID=1033263 RepID=A0AAD7GE88_MYCRO|nr:hypothetical protein B0H17DRAFT_1134077 [Mycena rosella]